MTDTLDLWTDEEWRAAMSTADINDLPDSDFAYIEPGGTKDDEGKTTPRSLRHFPIHDKAHVQNALARLSSSPFGAKAKPKVLAAAKKFGIDVSDEHADESPDTETRADHAAYTGSHSHAHAAFGSQGDDDTHEHEHSHDGDADHHHAHNRSAPSFPASQRAEIRGSVERRFRSFDECEIRMVPDGTGGSEARFTGYAAVFGIPTTITDFLGEFTETVQRSAFDKTIAQACDTNFLLNHGGMSLARTKSGTLKLSTDERGLHVDARLDKNNYQVAALQSAIDRKDMTEMSFAFRCVRDEWNKAYDDRQLIELNLQHGDVSAVNFGAYSDTAILAMRSRGSGLLAPSVPSLRSLLHEVRAGASLSSAATATLKHVLSLAATADNAVDEAQVVLSEFLKVPNPDADDGEQKSATLRIFLTGDAAGAVADESRSNADGNANGCSCCEQCTAGCSGSCCDECMGIGDMPPSSGGSMDQAVTNDATSAASMSLYKAQDADRERRLRALERGDRP